MQITHLLKEHMNFIHKTWKAGIRLTKVKKIEGINMLGATTVILIKESGMGTEGINTHYILPLVKQGIAEEEIAVLPLLYNTPARVLAKTAKAYLDKLIGKIPESVSNLIIADSSYFKCITKKPKVSGSYGTVVKGGYDGYTKFNCVYVPNHKSLFKQPENAKLIELGINAIAGNEAAVVIKYAKYGYEFGSDREILDSLYEHPILSVDIETTGLGIDELVVSISLSWSKHEGVAIDLSITGLYYLKKFIENYTGKLVFHGGLFDAKLLIRNMWMQHNTDYDGMMEGLAYFKDFDDTMIMGYLAKNATTKVSLGLKEMALEYVGNYALELDDITKYTKKEILEYNLIDSLGTFYLYEKYQDELASRPYKEIFQPSLVTLLKMMLVGLPMDSDRVNEVHTILEAKEKILSEQIQLNPKVISFNKILQVETCEKANAKLKKLVKTIDQFADVTFNPNSHPQLAKLLHDFLKLPILETTKTKAPATGGDVLEDLKNHTQDTDILNLLQQIQDLSEVIKINGTFIKAFLQETDFLHGSLKLGGTQSGRLSSSDPNLTNLPAHGPMGKLVKSCIVAPPGWLFAGADFSALEERIGAVLSKDPNRVAVYTQGMDGHSMRALKYFGDQMPDIDPNNVASINSIETKYPELRQNSKAPTFALQYLGTAYTLHKRAGFSMHQAEQIEKSFHELYVVSGEFNKNNRKLMEKNGYVECAFGLKLRTPIITKCVMGNSSTPYEADKEARSANNAVTQSWGMLLNRAMNATNARIENAGYATSILPCNMIHDAGYFLVKDHPIYIQFLNDVLIQEMEWNEDPLIKSKDVPMKATLEIGVSWDKMLPLKNYATIEEIKGLHDKFQTRA